MTSVENELSVDVVDILFLSEHPNEKMMAIRTIILYKGIIN